MPKAFEVASGAGPRRLPALLCAGEQARLTDITAAREIPFAPGKVVVFNRSYSDYAWWLKLTRSGVTFVTRLKDSADCGVMETRPVPPGSDLARDETILLTSQQELGPQARVRRIEVWAE